LGSRTLSVISTISGSGSAIYHERLSGPSSRLNLAILLSVILHAAVLFGISFQPFIEEVHVARAPLEVVLVNSRSASKPHGANALAQANLDGGGNTDRDRGAKTSVRPSYSKGAAADAARDGLEKTVHLEQEAQKLMTAVASDLDMYQPDLPQQGQQGPESNPVAFDATDLVQRSFEIARLEAQTVRDFDAYQKRPKRKFIGVRTQEYRFARYVEDWRLKVERIGNLNYPEAARRERLYGDLQLTVGIKADGSLESVEINRPSGKKILDEAAIRIVKLAGQNGFSPFPPEISQDTDILHITRTWAFTHSDELKSQ
jgi:periplasmic protein TonB